ncbi:hypothetical protein BASA81_017939 [Batrachochytrium salamandrivorans]|nr:hypothetical protein BASA81_017939 [Batrachochytrium salamandrivorans]
MKFRALVVAAMVITSTPVQYSEATRNRGGYGLHDSDNSEDSDDSDDEEDNIYERPACDSMLATLRGLQDDISRLSREHSDGLSALCELKDGESHWKDWGLGSRFTSRDISKAELEHTKKKVDVLKERYTGVLEEFLSIGCSTKVHNPMSLEEVDDLKKFLSNLVESSDCGDEQETSV